MPQPFQDTFDVTVENEDGSKDTYTFRIPGIRFDIEVAYRAADIRNRIAPQSGGAITGLDMQSIILSRSGAILELYLVKATTLWPYGVDEDDVTKVDTTRKPAVDFDKFPFNRTDDVYRVGARFEEELARFRRRGNTGKGSAGGETVGRGEDPGASQPVG